MIKQNKVRISALNSLSESKMRIVESELTKLNVVSLVVDDIGVSKDGHVLELSLSNGWAVVGNDQKLGLSVSESLLAEFVT